MTNNLSEISYAITHRNQPTIILGELKQIPAGWTIITKEQYQKLTKHIPTKVQLSEWMYQEKCKIAYTGVIVIMNTQEYIFETDKDSITMCNSQAIALAQMEDITEIKWKVYKKNLPILITLTKKQFLSIFSFGMQMINQSFAVEGERNTIIEAMTKEQLENDEYINTFKIESTNKFNQINKYINIEKIK